MDEVVLRSLENLSGQAAAENLLLEVLIATHPQPKLLRAVWLQCRPGHVDTIAGLPHADSSPAREACIQRLAVLSQAIDRAAGIEQ